MGAWLINEDGTETPLGKKCIKSVMFTKRLIAKRLGLYPKIGGRKNVQKKQKRVA